MLHPGNLSRQALADFEDILERSRRRFGEQHAIRFRDRVIVTCNRIAGGENHGHTRRDVNTSITTRFIGIDVVMIAYNPKSRMVLRILDGRRDFSRKFLA